ncbi:MAG: hypothetical protein DDT19_01611 [Syntrophomonadaceae bacterium]|nr:hypothetical protein [Bacillota bacterium]
MEVLVFLGLIVSVLVAVQLYLPLGSLFWERNASLAEAQQHGRIAMEELSHELQYAYRVNFEQQGRVLTYYKRVDGVLKRYRIYLRRRQLLLDLPTGTAVPLAGWIEDFWAEPSGELGARQLLRLGVIVGQGERRLKMQKAVSPRNVGKEW